MYKRDDKQICFFDYTMEDMFKLDADNRWVKKAHLVPWDMAEEKYAHMFRKHGRPAKSIRMALGALIIQQTKGLSDEETVQEIMESPYLQYFVGMKGFSNEKPFDPSLMVWFRKRLSAKFMAEINDAMCNEAAQETEPESPADDDDEPHGGTLIVDATCVPADITYPTDTKLLAKAIEKTDAIIDTLHEPHRGKRKRPRTYRRIARKTFVNFTKNRKPGWKLIRKCKRKQLGFLSRNLKAIHELLGSGETLTDKALAQLTTIEKVHEQQLDMYRNKSHRIADRIVSLSQPHIRPIVRGKSGAPVEFGAKVDLSVVNGYVFINEIRYDAFHEGLLLEDAILDYYDRFKKFPKEVLCDRAYQTRSNREFCKSLGIRLMGKPLGRPRKDRHAESDSCYDASRRVEVEGKFGTLKMQYGWSRIMPRLPQTGKTAIWVAAFSMNLSKRARSFWHFLLSLFHPLLASTSRCGA